MDPPPAPSFHSSSPSSSSASIPMVVITVVGILAAFALLASYYAFVTKCQVLRALSWRSPPWRLRRGAREAAASTVIQAVAAEGRGLGLPLIRMLPVVKFTAAAVAGGNGDDGGGVVAGRISVSECAVCLSEFVERERVRLLPNCSHAFHIDCIDTWLQGSARCPFCRSDVTLPPAPSRRASCGDDTGAGAERAWRHRDGAEADSIVIEVRGEHESWVDVGRKQQQRRRKKPEMISVGDEAIDTRKKDEEFAVQPVRRSLSMNSTCCVDKQLYLSVQEFILTHRQV